MLQDQISQSSLFYADHLKIALATEPMKTLRNRATEKNSIKIN